SPIGFSPSESPASPHAISRPRICYDERSPSVTTCQSLVSLSRPSLPKPPARPGRIGEPLVVGNASAIKLHHLSVEYFRKPKRAASAAKPSAGSSDRAPVVQSSPYSCRDFASAGTRRCFVGLVACATHGRRPFGKAHRADIRLRTVHGMHATRAN